MLAHIADAFGRHMLISARVLLHGGGMQAALMREGRRADISGMASGRAIEDLVEQARDTRELAQLRRVTPVSNCEAIRLLQHQRRQSASTDWHCRSVRPDRSVCPEPAARRRAPRPATDGDGLFGIVVGVDAERRLRQFPLHLADDARTTSSGSVPPLVSHSTSQRAPASCAARRQSSA